MSRRTNKYIFYEMGSATHLDQKIGNTHIHPPLPPPLCAIVRLHLKVLEAIYSPIYTPPGPILSIECFNYQDYISGTHFLVE